MAFNKITDILNVHQSRATIPVEDSPTLKQLYDQDVNTVKTRFNEHIDELSSTVQGSSGASNIGINAVGVVATNVNDAISEIQSNIVVANLGQIIDGSLEDIKLSPDGIKKKVNLITITENINLDDIATELISTTSKTDINSENIDILRLAKDSTGSLNAYVLDTPAVFDLTKDGNIGSFNPNFTNTGACTINIDGTTKAIKKFNIYTDTYVSLDSGDIKKNNPVFLRFDVSEDFFVLAPRIGAVSTQNNNNTSVAKSININELSSPGITYGTQAIVLPGGCKVFEFTDSRLNGDTFSTVPMSYMFVSKSTLNGIVLNAYVRLYSSTGALIGTIASLSRGDGFTGSINNYFQKISLIQIGNTIRSNVNIINGTTSTLNTNLFTGDLSGAKIAVDALITGTISGSLTIRSLINGVYSTYSG